MLEIGDSTMTYRSRYVTVPLPAPTADLLVLDETNPRSLAFQLSRLDELMGALPTDGPYRKPEHRRVIAALTELRMYNADALVQAPMQDEDGKQQGEPAPWPLHVILDSVHQAMLEAADLISQNHFVIADTPITSYSLKRSVEQ
jgi:uncharacterized alpha-E superfamily protein